jgi:hypothetical protein
MARVPEAAPQVALDAVRDLDADVVVYPGVREMMMRRKIRKYAVLLAMGIVAMGSLLAGRARAVVAQIPQAPGPGSSGASMPSSSLPTSEPGIGPSASNPNDPATMRMKHERQIAVDNDRHKRMVADANKLLEMATELKAEVDKSTPNETSVTAYNKADQIEKLAHDVKQRLKE